MIGKILLFFLGLLFLIWPIPHTVTIRELSLIAGLLFSIGYIYKHKMALTPFRNLRLPILFYFLFISWIVFVAIFISTDTHWAFKELKSQWLWGSLAMMFGSFVGIIIKKNPKLLSSAMMVFFLALLIHVAVINVDGLSYIMLDGFDKLTYTTRLTSGLTIGPIDASVLCDFLLVLVLSEWLYRREHNNKIIPISNNDLIFAFVLTFTGSILCGLRNMVELTMIILFIPMLAFQKNRKIIFGISLAFFIALTIFMYKTDPRWSEIGKSIDLAFNTEYDWNIEPKDATIEPIKGQIVNTSNYLRFEKYQTSIYTIAEKPFGVGYGRNAFGHGIKDKYDKATGLNSDSSFLDLFIGTGVIGGILWLCFYGSLFYFAFTSFKNGKTFASGFLLLLLVTFGTRAIIDTIFRDHLMQQFLFMVGLSFIFLKKEVETVLLRSKNKLIKNKKGVV